MASILEAFGIIFDLESDQAKKKTEDLSKATDDYEKKANKADLSSQKLSGSLLKMGVQIGGVITALFSVGAVMGGIASSVGHADAIGKAADSLGIATEELSAWSDAAKASGGSAEGLQSSVRNLSKDLYQFAETGNSRAAPFLKSLGIAMTDASGKARDVFDVLPDIAEVMEGMSKQEAIGFGQKLGLDQGTIMLLSQGKVGLEEVLKKQKELGSVSKEDAEAAAKFNDALDDTAHAFRTIYTGIATFILPAFTWLLEKVQKATGFIKEHGYFFKIVIMGMATAITMFLLPALYSAAAAMWANPLTWLIAGILLLIGLIALIAEDIYMFSIGGQSLIGQLANKFKWFGDTVKYLGALFKQMHKDVTDVIDFFINMWNNPEQALEDFKAVLGQLWDDFIDSVPGLRAILDTIVAIFNTAIAGIKKAIEAVTDSIKKTKDTLSVRVAPAGFDKFDANTSSGSLNQASIDAMANYRAQQKLETAQAQTSSITQMSNNTLASTSNHRSNVANTTNNNTVTVNTSADPKDVEKVLNNVLESKTKTAMQQMDDGVSH